MKMCDMIPSLKLTTNMNIKNVKPENMTKSQLKTIFQIIGDILEFNGQSTQADQEEFERYQNSYMRKRTLRTWKTKRNWILTHSHCETSRKLKVYHQVYQEVKPFIVSSFYEEYGESELSIDALSLRAFLWNQEFITKKYHRYQDSKYWGEMIEMVDLLQESQLKEK